MWQVTKWFVIQLNHVEIDLLRNVTQYACVLGVQLIQNNFYIPHKNNGSTRDILTVLIDLNYPDNSNIIIKYFLCCSFPYSSFSCSSVYFYIPFFSTFELTRYELKNDNDVLERNFCRTSHCHVILTNLTVWFWQILTIKQLREVKVTVPISTRQRINYKTISTYT